MANRRSDDRDTKAPEQAPAPAAPAPAPDPRWTPLDPVGLKERLSEVRSLLVQAAAVGLAQDVAHLEQYAELERRAREGARGPKNRRRYR